MAFGGENAESYYDEGLTASMKGDLEFAVQCFTRAIEMDKTFVVAYHQLGKCYLRLGNPRKAVDILRQVVVRRPHMIPARLDLGNALMQLGRPQDARKEFMEIVAQNPDNGRAHLGLAQASFLEGKWKEAVALAQIARAKGGSNFGVLYLLGRAAKLAGNHMLAEEALKEADALIEKTVELSPDNPEGYYLRGEVCFAQERFSAALDHFRNAEDRADPQKSYSAFGENFTRVDVMVKRALCLQRLGNIEDARALGQKVVELAPGHKLGQALKGL